MKFIKGSIAATLGLLLAVMLVQWAIQLLNGANFKSTGELTGNVMLAGFVADAVRGCLLAYLYPQMKNAGSSYRHAIRFGLVTSLLVATLWVIYQYGVRTSLSTAWLMEESIIILSQGVFSGIGLGWAYRMK